MKKSEIPARQIEKLLKARYKVPDALLRQYRVVCADKAVQDGTEVKMNRIYSITALALARYTRKKGYKWGIKRLTEFLNFFSELYEEFVNGDDSWRKLMETLRNETGIVIRTGEEGDEICEYMDEAE